MEIVSELIQGQELTRQLEAQLNSDTSIELCRSILSSFEKAICLVKSRAFDGEQQPACATESPRSFTGSPRSENSDQPLKVEERKERSKMRKAQPKWTSHVRLGSGPGAEGPLDDGYNWRKYGQKEILGAKHPRGYYRCTHRNSQGCQAMKQVQKSDENPVIFDVTYRGTHTCHRKSSPPTSASPGHDYNKNQRLLSIFQTNLTVKTKNLDSENQERTSSPFSFPTTPVNNNVKSENCIFSPSSMLDNCFKGSFSTVFVSPVTSESNNFSMLPCSYGGGANLQASEYDLTEIVSAETSVTNSPMLDMDLLLESVEFDSYFPIDTSSFFS